MSMRKADFVDELQGMVDKLPPFYAERCVDRAWRKIRSKRLWSFLRGQVALSVPAMIQSGTVAVTRYSNTVVADATAAADWVATGLNIPITMRQFRVLGGSIYNITAFDGVNTITIDRPFQEPTNAASEYNLYKCYYEAPTDFRRWESIIDPVNAYTITRQNLARTRKELDNADPQRQSFSNPIWAVPYKVSSSGLYMFELWPHPIQQLGYLATYETKGYTVLGEDEDLPPMIPEELLATYSKLYAFEWAMIQPYYKDADWKALVAEAKVEGADLLKVAMNADEDAFLQGFFPDESGRPVFPISADWMQSHDF